MADFKIAYKVVKRNEGGYANNPNDRGGETYKGIARKMHPDWVGWEIVDNLKNGIGFPAKLEYNKELQVMVQDFFKIKFWNRLSLNEVLDQDIATELFDTGVNMGTGVAATFLQRSLNVLNRGGKDYPDVMVDGIIGRKTISTLNVHKHPDKVLRVLNILQGAKYIAIAEANHSQETFMYGWLERT